MGRAAAIARTREYFDSGAFKTDLARRVVIPTATQNPERAPIQAPDRIRKSSLPAVAPPIRQASDIGMTLARPVGGSPRRIAGRNSSSSVMRVTRRRTSLVHRRHYRNAGGTDARQCNRRTRSGARLRRRDRFAVPGKGLSVFASGHCKPVCRSSGKSHEARSAVADNISRNRDIADMILKRVARFWRIPAPPATKGHCGGPSWCEIFDEVKIIFC
jgi:hypothetical protein